MNARKTIDSLQAGRAAAAILVVLYHTNLILSAQKYFSVEPFGKLPRSFGNAGVSFFFVLSGFIIVHAHRYDIGTPSRLASYVRNRVTRIFPPYWAATALVYPAQVVFHASGGVLFWVSTITLLPIYANQAVLPVAWTLFYEILFYLLFMVVVADRLVGFVFIGLWASLCVAALIGVVFPSALGFVSSPLNLLFLFGGASSRIYGSGWSRYPLVLSGLGFAVFSGTAISYSYFDPHFVELEFLLFGIGSALIIMGLSIAERHGWVAIPRSLSFLGAASYSIYLVHYPALSFMAKVALKYQAARQIPSMLLFLMFSVAATLIGIAFYRIVERPLLSAVRGKLGRRKYAFDKPLVPMQDG